MVSLVSFYLALKGVNMHELEETFPMIVSCRVSHICFFFSKKNAHTWLFFHDKIYTFPQDCKNVYIFSLDWKRFSSAAAAYMHGAWSWWELCAQCIYESIATVGEIGVWWRADFQSGSRVLKKVFWTFSYLYLWHTMWFHAKKLLKSLIFWTSLNLLCKSGSRPKKSPNKAQKTDHSIAIYSNHQVTVVAQLVVVMSVAE